MLILMELQLNVSKMDAAANSGRQNPINESSVTWINDGNDFLQVE